MTFGEIIVKKFKLKESMALKDGSWTNIGYAIELHENGKRYVWTLEKRFKENPNMKEVCLFLKEEDYLHIIDEIRAKISSMPNSNFQCKNNCDVCPWTNCVIRK